MLLNPLSWAQTSWYCGAPSQSCQKTGTDAYIVCMGFSKCENLGLPLERRQHVGVTLLEVLRARAQTSSYVWRKGVRRKGELKLGTDAYCSVHGFLIKCENRGLPLRKAPGTRGRLEVLNKTQKLPVCVKVRVCRKGELETRTDAYFSVPDTGLIEYWTILDQFYLPVL